MEQQKVCFRSSLFHQKIYVCFVTYLLYLSYSMTRFFERVRNSILILIVPATVFSNVNNIQDKPLLARLQSPKVGFLLEGSDPSSGITPNGQESGKTKTTPSSV